MMVLPPEVQTTTIEAQRFTPGGSPQKGSIVFIPSVETFGVGFAIIPDRYTAPLDKDGKISVDLPTSTNTGLEPDGWTYEVRELYPGAVFSRYYVKVPYSIDAIQLDSLERFDSASEPSPYATKAELAALESRINFTHVQYELVEEIPVNHKLGYYPSVVFTDTTGENIIPGVHHVDTMNAILRFGYPIAGRADFN